MESDLAKGYRGAAERSSNVGVPAFPSSQNRPVTPSSALACRAMGSFSAMQKVGVPEKCAVANLPFTCQFAPLMPANAHMIVLHSILLALIAAPKGLSVLPAERCP